MREGGDETPKGYGEHRVKPKREKEKKEEKESRERAVRVRVSGTVTERERGAGTRQSQRERATKGKLPGASLKKRTVHASPTRPHQNRCTDKGGEATANRRRRTGRQSEGTQTDS